LAAAFGADGRGGALRARTLRFAMGAAVLAATAVFLVAFEAALALAFGFLVALAGFVLRGARFIGRRACFLACLTAAFFTVFFVFGFAFVFAFRWAMTTFSSNKSLASGLTYGRCLTDNRLLSVIPRAATDSPSKLEIRHRAAQEAPQLNE
jgi:hypothetical protein